MWTKGEGYNGNKARDIMALITTIQLWVGEVVARRYFTPIFVYNPSLRLMS